MNEILKPDEILLRDLFDIGSAEACELCGCTLFDPCPGGCAWSEYFADRGRAVCTSCETIMIAMELNFGALAMWFLRARRPDLAVYPMGANV